MVKSKNLHYFLYFLLVELLLIVGDDIPMEKKIHFCKNCGKELNERHKTYCDHKCQADYQYKLYIEHWKNGGETGIKGKYKISNHIRRYLKEKYNNSCSRCGWSEINPYTEIVPLEIEHKDGNYLNNNEDNLDLICPNCHSLTSTYKGANRGNGRRERNKYNLPN